MGPGLAAPGAGIHRQRAAHGAGDPGQELDPDQIVPGRKARQLGAGDPGLGTDPVAPQRVRPVRQP
jgi:hypothetical protein